MTLSTDRLPWSDAVVEKVAQHLWHCTSTRHKLPWSEIPEMAKRGARREARELEQIVKQWINVEEL